MPRQTGAVIERFATGVARVQSLGFVAFLVNRQKPLAVAPHPAQIALERLFAVA